MIGGEAEIVSTTDMKQLSVQDVNSREKEVNPVSTRVLEIDDLLNNP